jgi:hypothetical protein
LVLVFYEKRKLLSSIPEQLKGFAVYVEKVKGIKTDRIPIETAANHVETMSSLLRQFEVKIPPSDSVQLDSLREARKEFDSALANIDSACLLLCTCLVG